MILYLGKWMLGQLKQKSNDGINGCLHTCVCVASYSVGALPRYYHNDGILGLVYLMSFKCANIWYNIK